jgi:hypothetical protein
MNLENFNNNFTVKIVHFDDTTSNVVVKFKVRCVFNNRVSLHIATADTTQLSEGYTISDVASLSWNNIKTTVNQWASYNISKNKLSDLTITSTSNVIDLSTFNSNFNVKSSFFDALPDTNPTDWSLHYVVTRNNNSNLSYGFECLVPLTQQNCNNTLCADIAAEGWELVKESACNWAYQNLPVETVVDTIFVPVSI